MREAVDARAYLKFEENVIVCIGKSIATKNICLFFVEFKNTDYVKLPVLSPESSENQILYVTSGTCSNRNFERHFKLTKRTFRFVNWDNIGLF